MLKLSSLGIWNYIFLLIGLVTLLMTAVNNFLHNHIIVIIVHCCDSQNELGSTANTQVLAASNNKTFYFLLILDVHCR